MKFSLFICLLSFFSYSQTQIGSDINGEMATDRSSRVALSADGNIVAIGAIGNDGSGLDSGNVRVFQNVTGTWIQMGNNINGEATIDQSGSALSISSNGNIVAIGAIGNDGNGSGAGHVRVYQNNASVWTQIGVDIDGEAAGDQSSKDISLSADGSIVAIGAPTNDGNGLNSGHVRVFQNNVGVWTQIGADINGEAAGDEAGHSVSLSSNGSILAIGSIGNDINGNNSGQVRVFQNIANVWTQIGNDINGEAAEDLSGFSISLSSNGNKIAIGARNNSGNGVASGHVRVFENIANEWTQLGSDINGESVGDYFGDKVSLSGDGNTLAVGAFFNDGNGNNSGHVRIFQYNAGVWTQVGSDINGEAADDQSGAYISLSSNGSIIAIGAAGNNGNGTDSGHIRIYDLSSILTSDSFVLDNFLLYPNPVSSILTIKLSENLEMQKVTIYNSMGQFLKTENKKTIDVSSFAKGNYFIEVITNRGKATKTILIK